MDELTLPYNLSEDIRRLARLENRTEEEVVESMIKQYQPKLEREEIRLRIARKLYPIAREYWQQVGDQQRLALTDEELDAQFWLFDHDGIPRLKEDQDKIVLPPDPLEGMIGLITDADPDLSVSVRETIEKRFNSKPKEPNDEESSN